jgi:hypothetical protein
MVFRQIGANAHHPIFESVFGFVSMDLAIGLNKGFLRDVGGFMIISGHPPGQVENGVLIAADQFLESAGVPGAGLLGELTVISVHHLQSLYTGNAGFVTSRRVKRRLFYSGRMQVTISADAVYTR